MMCKTTFADPHDDFDEDFINWMADILKDINDPNSDYDDHNGFTGENL
jgi:hypothetical protein